VVDRGTGAERQAPATAVLTLQPRTDAAALARKFVHDHRDHLDPDIIENAQLLVSEIVTNAVRHGAGEICLTIRLDPLTAPRRTRAFAALCDQLNVTATRYPGTQLTLRYQIKDHPGTT